MSKSLTLILLEIERDVLGQVEVGVVVKAMVWAVVQVVVQAGYFEKFRFFVA